MIFVCFYKNNVTTRNAYTQFLSVKHQRLLETQNVYKILFLRTWRMKLSAE